MSEMIETVAMALFERERAKPFVYTTLLLYGDPPCEWDDLADPVKNDFRDQARAATAPVHEMLLSMLDAVEDSDTESVVAQLRRMIDEALR